MVLAGAALALALAGSACGTRLSMAQAQRQVAAVYGAAGSSAAFPAAAPTAAAAVLPYTVPTTTVPTTTSEGAVPTGATGPAPPASGGVAGPVVSAGPAQRSAGGTSSSPSTVGGASTGAVSGPKAPILLGMSCNCSGVVGAAEAPARDAYQAWIQMINARGGIDGHLVKLFYADDDDSSTQDLQNVKTFVEQDHVIALVNFFEASGGIVPVAQYAAQKHVPVVGGSGFDPAWTSYPSMFSTATADSAQDYSWAAEMKSAGKTTVGAVYCAEADVCAAKEGTWKKAAQQLGLNVAYENRESLAAPSFSADCINARSKGVTGLVIIEDGASAARVARDCNQQGFHPLIVVTNPFNNPPSYLDGAVAPLGSFPWFLTSGSPALTEYGSAIAKYVHNPTDTFTSLGWANAKLLEKALTGHVSAAPTSQDVFTGLWAMRGETLGGLTPPLSFHANANASPVVCSYRAVAQNGSWVAPLGMQTTDCAP
jgi:branched-chain amino acid transport system substrate-binding protein